jgi:hypothetical protein
LGACVGGVWTVAEVVGLVGVVVGVVGELATDDV